MEHSKKRKAKHHMDKLSKKSRHRNANYKMVTFNRPASPILRDRSDDDCSDESIDKSTSTSESAELMSEEEFCPISELEGYFVESAIDPDTRCLNSCGTLR